MKGEKDLRRQLAAIDGRGYPAYKSLRGRYDMGGFTLSVDHVQGDPFAAPSKLSVQVPAGAEGLPGFPERFYSVPHRRTALEDLMVRRFSREAAHVSFKAGGSGKSGLIATSKPGPEVLPRSACTVDEQGVTLRFEAGFPAHGRTVDARALERMLCELVPQCVRRALAADEGAVRAAQEACDLADDQAAARAELERLGLVAFVADGSVLPRDSGVSTRPMRGAKPFAAPESMRVVLDLPHRGQTPGMGVRRGVTLVVGGGFHGKSTLLKALQEGVYNHVAGDGRELAVTDASAVKLRAEDGRAVHGVDISPFIGVLPDGRATESFSTSDASGSTSQAASTAEALEMGARVLLMDEDTSATNFMVRDALMEAVVSPEHEPITPFVERVRELWERDGVSSVIVVGSSGAFFSEADAVVQMDAYEAFDVTERVRAVCRSRDDALGAGDKGKLRRSGAGDKDDGGRGGTCDKIVSAPLQGKGQGTSAGSERRPAFKALAASARGDSRGRGGRGHGRGADARLKVRASGLDELSVGKGSADVRLVEQLVDVEQAAAIAQMVRVLVQRGTLDGSRTLPEAADELLAELGESGWGLLAERGTAACGLALPRREELIACLNRWRA